MHCRILIALTLSMLAACTSAAASKCVLPVPDGGDTKHSPPSIVGTIYSVLHISPHQTMLQVNSKNRKRRIVVDADTKLFTVYGGGFERRELREGQHTYIWFTSCTASKLGVAFAAVLQVCSLNSEPCPKASNLTTQSRGPPWKH